MTTRLTAIRRRHKGAAFLEFTLVGIPMIFILISIFEMSRGMWMYHTLAHGAKEGARWASLRGKSRVARATYQAVCAKITEQGAGLVPAEIQVSITPSSGATVTHAGNACPATTIFPGATDNQAGQPLMVRVTYRFNSALAMFWPGSRPVGFSAVTLSATAREAIQF